MVFPRFVLYHFLYLRIAFKATLVVQMVKRLPHNVEDSGLIPGLGRSPGKGNDNPLLPAKFHGQRSLMGYSPRDHKESDTTERLHFHFCI